MDKYQQRLILVYLFLGFFLPLPKDLNPRWKLMDKYQRQFLTKTLAPLLSTSSRWSRRRGWRRIKRKRSDELQDIWMWSELHIIQSNKCFADTELKDVKSFKWRKHWNQHLPALKVVCFCPLFKLICSWDPWHFATLQYDMNRTIPLCFIDFRHNNL